MRVPVEKVLLTTLALGAFFYVGNHVVDSVSLAEHEYREVLSQQEEPDPMPNWNNLIFCKAKYVSNPRSIILDPKWKTFKASLRGMEPLKQYLSLERWLWEHQFDDASLVQVTNYVVALKRGGLNE